MPKTTSSQTSATVEEKIVAVKASIQRIKKYLRECKRRQQRGEHFLGLESGRKDYGEVLNWTNLFSVLENDLEILGAELKNLTEVQK